MRETKKLKFTNKLSSLSIKLKWFLFTEMQDYRLTSDYIDFICPNTKKALHPLESLENLVKQSLIREFSPSIQKLKSFDSLVDAVAHRIRTKSLETE